MRDTEKGSDAVGQALICPEAKLAYNQKKIFLYSPASPCLL